MALLNRGGDLLNGFVRTSLTGHARTMTWGHHNPEAERHPYRAPSSSTRLKIDLVPSFWLVADRWAGYVAAPDA